jgi:hypothetical protein
MTLGEILALLKDLAIVAAIFWVYHMGQAQVKTADLKAVQTQMAANAQQEAAWAKERSDHDAQLQNQLGATNAAIAANSHPVIVQNRPRPVSSTPAAAGSNPPASGGAVEATRRDIRPQLNAFELRLEQTIADCHRLDGPHL